MAVPQPPPGFDDLSVDEKLDYLQSLWERTAAAAATIPVPDWHHEVVRERLDDLAAHQTLARSGPSFEIASVRS
jgi:hypothetical protein